MTSLPHTLSNRFALALGVRAVFYWLGVRALIQVAYLLLQLVPLEPRPVQLSAGAAAVVVAAAVAMVAVQARNRNEVVILANLGVGPWGVVWRAATPAAVLELVLRVAA